MRLQRDVGASAVAPAAGARRLARAERTQSRRPIDRDRASQQLEAERRELPVARAVRWTIGADRHGQPGLRAEPGRPRGGAAGARHGARRRYRQGDLGVQVQHLPERRAAASHRLGVARRRSRNRQHLRAERRRSGDRAQPRRQAALEPIARRRVGGLHHTRRPDDVAGDRRRSGHRQRTPYRTGARAAPAPIASSRSTSGPARRLRRQPGRPPVRHGVRIAGHRHDQRHAAAHRRPRRRRRPCHQGADRRTGLELCRLETGHQHRRRGERQHRVRLAR